MKIFKKQEKSTPGWGYWGNYGEIDLGFSFGVIENSDSYSGESLHYHKNATTYILVLEGSGIVRVAGRDCEINTGELLQIDPMEQYKMLQGVELPFRWVTVSTNKEPGDRVVVEEGL
jgi:mannose-6-phosphate isomerase-like protein (cupin superfamily)